jgi:alkaline phosphatase D
MKIAFASCMCTRIFSAQPVWDHIAAHQPDALVLLGDSIYLDIRAPSHPQTMGDDAFAQHLFALYTELLAQPQFVRLVQLVPLGRVFSIWDDHDFLWNDAQGAELRDNPIHAGKVRLSTAFQEAFRRALAKGLVPGSFPSAYNDPVLWQWPAKALSTPSVELGGNVWLHLSDVRSFRTATWLRAEAKRTLLGEQQRQQLSKRIQASAPDALHLFASGSTLAGWKRYSHDLQWLHTLAAQRRTLFLSGDIHRNEVDAFHTGGWPLHEATSSGAAVRDAVSVGTKQENHGLLDIDAQTLQVRMFRKGVQQMALARTIDRKSWLLRPMV